MIARDGKAKILSKRIDRPSIRSEMDITGHGVVIVNASSVARLLKSNGVLESARKNMRFYTVNIPDNVITKKFTIKAR